MISAELVWAKWHQHRIRQTSPARALLALGHLLVPHAPAGQLFMCCSSAQAAAHAGQLGLSNLNSCMKAGRAERLLTLQSTNCYVAAVYTSPSGPAAKGAAD